MPRTYTPTTGAHIRCKRSLGYWHHGIDCGDGSVIHYTGEVGAKQDAAVRQTSLVEFSDGDEIESVEYASSFDAAVVVARAASRLGESNYELFGNNCEHFARWAKTGDHSSEQVRNAAGTASASGVVAGATSASIGAVSAAGAVAGLSGPGVMSGLATVGSLVGGGAVTGVVLLGAAPAVASAEIVNKLVFSDDEKLDTTERSARSAARLGTRTGTAMACAGSVGVLYAAGTTGLSAAGITSGLAAVGSVVGGGMVAGTAALVAAPAILGVGLGYAAYRYVTRRRKPGASVA